MPERSGKPKKAKRPTTTTDPNKARQGRPGRRYRSHRRLANQEPGGRRLGRIGGLKGGKARAEAT